MGTMEVILWSFVELVKYTLVINGVLGCKIRKDWKKHLAVVYIVFGGIGWSFLVDYLFLYKVTFGLIMILFVFEERISVKIRGYLISYLAINIADLFLWSFLINLFPVLEQRKELNNFSNLIGIIWWLGIVMLVRKQQCHLDNFRLHNAISLI